MAMLDGSWTTEQWLMALIFWALCFIAGVLLGKR
jgi:hypothetical protein